MITKKLYVEPNVVVRTSNVFAYVICTSPEVGATGDGTGGSKSGDANQRGIFDQEEKTEDIIWNF